MQGRILETSGGGPRTRPGVGRIYYTLKSIPIRISYIYYLIKNYIR